MDQATYDAARQVIAFAELSSVRVVRCKVAATPGNMDANEKVSLSVRTRSSARRANAGRMLCVLKFDLNATIEGSDIDRVEISVDFEAAYTLPEEKRFSIKQLNAFASTNALLNVWPYWRELVQSFTTRAGLPALTLPLFRVQLAKPPLVPPK
jgi:preprotein translocase subunit SecB